MSTRSDLSNQPQNLAGVSKEAVVSSTGLKPAILIENLTKKYGTSRGVTDLNLAVGVGEVFGFLGPNGAGKTTTIRLLLDLIKPTAGRATLLGLDSQRDSVAIKAQVGYLPGEFTLYPGLTGAETLEYFANLRGQPPREARQFVEQLARRFDLDLSKKFRQYSRGNKQKVGIIQAFLHHPQLLILDEPTGGLDPLNQQEFYRLLEEARHAGSTIFFSSHIISEVEKNCSQVGIIRDGKLIQVGELSALTDLKNHLLELTFEGQAPLAEFQRLPGVDKIELVETGPRPALHLTVRAENLGEVIRLAARYPLVNLVSREPSLEESFLNYYREDTQAQN